MIKTVGVCGLGQMGISAAVSFQRAGYQVLLWGRNTKKLEDSQQEIDRLTQWMIDQNGPAAKADGRIRLEADLKIIDQQSDAILECISEDLAVKGAFLAQLQNGFLLSTTSGLSITKMAEQSGVGPRLVGAHFWNPPHLMPIVEIIRGAQTPDHLMDEATNLIKSIQKIPVRVEKDVPGFIGNRLMHAMWREALHLLQHNVASAADIDLVARMTFGLRLPAVGPFENMDLVGLPLVSQVQSYLLDDLSNIGGIAPAIQERLDSGQIGMRARSGFYEWTPESAAALIDLRDRQILRQLEFLKEG
jgi:3-hydroxybutyryl-CoA dehydrogenase